MGSASPAAAPGPRGTAARSMPTPHCRCQAGSSPAILRRGAAAGRGAGGAIAANDILSVTSSTFSGNSASAGTGSNSGSLHGTDIPAGPGGSAFGGAISTTHTNSTIARSTLFGNSATGGTGGGGATIPPPQRGGDASGGGVYAAANRTL